MQSWVDSKQNSSSVLIWFKANLSSYHVSSRPAGIIIFRAFQTKVTVHKNVDIIGLRIPGRVLYEEIQYVCLPSFVRPTINSRVRLITKSLENSKSALVCCSDELRGWVSSNSPNSESCTSTSPFFH